MKKAKMMLTVIAVLAVVGGALAFKAKTAFNTSYCTVATADWSSNGKVCPNSISSGHFNDQSSGAVDRFYYVAGTGCDEATDCSISAFLHTGD